MVLKYMSQLRVEKFFCTSLRNGCKIIAGSVLVFSIFLMIAIISQTADLLNQISRMENLENSERYHYPREAMFLRVLFIMMITTSFVTISFGIGLHLMFFIGVVKKKTYLMYPVLSSIFAGLIAIFMFLISTIILVIIFPCGEMAYSMFYIFAILIVGGYCYMVMYSYYEKIREEDIEKNRCVGARSFDSEKNKSFQSIPTLFNGAQY